MSNQKGLVMVFALLVLLSITILGVSSVSSSLLQTKMASSLERKSLAFDAAEAALAGVVFEAEDRTVLSNPATVDALSQARSIAPLDLTVDELSCADANRVRREVTSNGMTVSTVHDAAAQFSGNGDVDSWSQTAFVREQACRGSSAVISGSNVTCHMFIVRGCGQTAGSSYTVANTMTASVFAPAAN
ncbi:PilX N-terminal domain-containing pilus assembly protein [Glaciecola siphonariae]|uniref:PilX N-terminal domain-containing pilus assembly protein n=1 Tax=Glaciecola siphonariae TaxID=521012 RepID=A0ABV9M1S4_9ALTE